MCLVNAVYGWHNKESTMKEGGGPYKLQVGYLKGSGPELTFRVTVEECTTKREYKLGACM